MKRLLMGLLSGVLIAGTTGIALAAGPLGATGLEESFVNAVGSCGPSSTMAGALGKSEDPGVRIALRNALIIEAADDAAGIGGGNKGHVDCMQKDLAAAGYTHDDMAALPYCAKNDWPSPFVSLGSCVQSHARLEAAMKKK